MSGPLGDQERIWTTDVVRRQIKADERTIVEFHNAVEGSFRQQAIGAGYQGGCCPPCAGAALSRRSSGLIPSRCLLVQSRLVLSGRSPSLYRRPL